MKLIDLHVHSNASDGTLTPSMLVAHAVDKNLAAIALTDHDTVQGVEEAIQCSLKYQSKGVSIEIIPGTELSADYEGTDIHILGYFVDYKDSQFLDILEKTQKERELRNIKMVHRLAKAGIDITMEKLIAETGEAVLTRAHFAKYLMEHHYTKSIKDAFTHYLSKKGPYYVPRQYISPKEAIGHIRSAGGIPVLAHPLLYHLTKEELHQLVEYLASIGLMGIETIYSANIGFDESDIRKLAREYQLIMTGGSDYHGSIKPHLEIGSGKGNLKIPYTILEELKSLLPVIK